MLDRITNTLLIQKNEKGTVAYFLVLFLIIGCGMAIGRSSADALFFKRYGIEHLPIMYLVLGGVLFIVTALYASFTDRIASERFLKPLIIIISSVLIACWISMTYFSSELVYPVYFIVYEVVSEILLVHCTIYIAQNLDVMQAKRLTPLVLAGWQAGTIIGGLLLASTAKILGVQNMLLIWVALLIAASVMVFVHHKKVGVSVYYRPGRKGRNQLKYAYEQLYQCFVFAKHSRLLRAMSFALFFMVITFYVLCYSVNRVYTETFVSEEELTMFFGILGAVTGTLGLFIQIFLTNRLIRRFGIRKMNLFFPAATLFAMGGLFFSFILPFAIVGSLVKDALMPALRNPVRTLFFNAIPTHMQGRAHSFSIGIVLPLALSAAGAILLLAQSVDSSVYYIGAGIITALVYLICNIFVNRSYLSAIITGLREKLYVPDENIALSLKGEEGDAFGVLAQASKHEDEEIRFISAKSMLELFPTRSAPTVIDVLSSLTPPLRDQLIRLLLPMEPRELRDKLWQELDNGDTHLKATVMYALFRLRDNKAKELAQKALDDINPRIRSIGIYGVLNYPLDELKDDAFVLWRNMLESQDLSNTLAGLDLLYQWPNADFVDSLLNLLRSEDRRIQISALRVLSVWPENYIPGLESLLTNYLSADDPNIREVATNCLVKLEDVKKTKLAKDMLEDIHPEVRMAAANILFDEGVDVKTLAKWVVSSNGSPRSQEAMVRRILSMNAPRQVMETLAYCFSEDAINILDAHSEIIKIREGDSKVTANMVILNYALEERSHEIIDLLLMAASEIEDPFTIGAIRAGIRSKERQHWANSCEAVRYIQDKRLASSLTIVLEKLGEELGFNKSVKQTRFSGLSSVLDWIGKKNDPWLLQCSLQVR